jgi:hypothetical protein
MIGQNVTAILTNESPLAPSLVLLHSSFLFPQPAELQRYPILEKQAIRHDEAILPPSTVLLCTY